MSVHQKDGNGRTMKAITFRLFQDGRINGTDLPKVVPWFSEEVLTGNNSNLTGEDKKP